MSGPLPPIATDDEIMARLALFAGSDTRTVVSKLRAQLGEHATVKTRGRTITITEKKPTEKPTASEEAGGRPPRPHGRARPHGYGEWSRCSAKSKQSGRRCRRWPIPGGTVCVMHGGKAPRVRAAARERLVARVDPEAVHAAIRAAKDVDDARELRRRAMAATVVRAAAPRSPSDAMAYTPAGGPRDPRVVVPDELRRVPNYPYTVAKLADFQPPVLRPLVPDGVGQVAIDWNPFDTERP